MQKTKANNSIKVTGEVNNLFTNDYFNNLIETVLVKTGHSFYRFNYSDGSYRILAILGNQIIVDDKEVYEAQEDINSIIQEQLVSQGE